jgi:hypothetical protein
MSEYRERATVYHTCTLPTDHPQYRTQDHCQGCNVARALFGHPAGVGPEGQGHHQDSLNFCTVPGCQICEE